MLWQKGLAMEIDQVTSVFRASYGPLSRGRRWDRRLRGRLLALELLVRLLGPLLQLLLQLFLLLLKLFGASRRTAVRLGEALERDDETDGVPRALDPLNDEALPFPPLAAALAAPLILAHPPG